MACVYDALGSKVTVVEMLDQLMTGADPDLVRVLAKRIGKRYRRPSSGRASNPSRRRRTG